MTMRNVAYQCVFTHNMSTAIGDHVSCIRSLWPITNCSTCGTQLKPQAILLWLHLLYKLWTSLQISTANLIFFPGCHKTIMTSKCILFCRQYASFSFCHRRSQNKHKCFELISKILGNAYTKCLIREYSKSFQDKQSY